jgi:Tol biopolymer transport system component
MKHKILLILTCFSIVVCNNITIHSACNEKLSLAIVSIGMPKELAEASSLIKRDLEFSGQLIVEHKNISKLTKEKILNLGKDFPLIIFLSYWSGQIEWRLYDGLSAKMIKGKKSKLPTNKKEQEFVLHKISDQIFPLITSEGSSFASTLVACKKSKDSKGVKITSIYSFYPSDTLSNKNLVVQGGVTLSPHWHPSKNVLFYSQHTPLNVRLMMLEDGHKRIISTFDGLNITPAFSADGKIVVSMTRNGKGRLCEYSYDKESKKGKFVSLTGPTIHAFAPTFIDNNRLVFSVIDQQKVPKVAVINLKDKKINYISKGSCLSPDYNKVRDELIYCKRVEGGREIFAYNLKTCKERQLTKDKSYKISCCWSPCGNNISFTEDAGNSRIAVLNLSTGQKRYLTTAREYWMSPAWAPKFEELFL